MVEIHEGPAISCTDGTRKTKDWHCQPRKASNPVYYPFVRLYYYYYYYYCSVFQINNSVGDLHKDPTFKEVADLTNKQNKSKTNKQKKKLIHPSKSQRSDLAF